MKAIAAAYCSMNDDNQALFFEEAGRIMETWGAGKMDTQMYSIGRHMRTCECIGERGGDFLRRVASYAMEEQK